MTSETSGSSIKHLGVVEEITPSNIKVSLVGVTGCAACHSRGSCSVSEAGVKIVDITNTDQAVKKGDQVTVVLEKYLGPLAIFLGYFLPFLILIAVLFVCWFITGNEDISAITALGATGLYYITLTAFRSTLQRTFTFRIQKG